MDKISLNIEGIKNFVTNDEINSLIEIAEKSNLQLHDKTGTGNDFLGWVNLPFEIDKEELEDIKKTAAELSQTLDIMVVIGIGGSYLGAKAVIEALSNNFSSYANLSKEKLTVLYAGHNISEDYLFEIIDFLNDKNWGITVISKSGTTTEPAITFRMLKNELDKKYGKKSASNRIIAITDKEKGALRELAAKENYKTYNIADDIGGRFSVLTAVGLFPIALAGFDVDALIEGAKYYCKETKSEIKSDKNIAITYAIARNILYQKGYIIEVMANYNPKLHYFAEWWKQLFGESEGKDGKGIFPASVDFTTDLHSMGQYLQDGKRIIFETVISIENPSRTLAVPYDKGNLDGLNYLSGRRVHEINEMSEIGTMFAHIDGGVPNIKINLPEINEYYLGQLIYFFEKACGISAYMLGVNPFNQPGVENYKNNMFALLGKKGFEEETKKIKKRIGR
ncbi:MAG: glucose-6-phosphate isomerase [Bacteroidales bacterium]|nr:glucose-6-phosphate isomerase [Bacteroidales bacterium]MBN2757361.1 glucose-6-phosphate isomerase [Bacteroidales bacterium]